MIKYSKAILILGLLLNISGCQNGNNSNVNDSISLNSTSSSEINNDLSSIVSNFSSSTGEKKEYRTTSYVNSVVTLVKNYISFIRMASMLTQLEFIVKKIILIIYLQLVVKY